MLREGVDIRPMILGDYAAVVTLWQAAAGIGLSAADEHKNIARYLDHNPGLSLVATADGAIVGAVLCGHDGRRGYIHHLAVGPDYRRMGIGKALVDRCLENLAAAEIGKCHLMVFAENREAVRFWEGAGWINREELRVFSHFTTE